MSDRPTRSDERSNAQRAVLARVAAVEADEARVFAAKMRLRAEMDELWNGGRGLDEGAQTHGYFGVIELAGTARIGQARATTQLVNGTRLVTVLTRTLAGLEAGEVFVETARLLLESTRNCNDAVAAEVERRVLQVIAPMCTTDARRLIEQTIPEVEADLDPALTDERLDAAASGASVWTRDLPDGMAQIGCNADLLSVQRWTADFEELVRAQVLADKRAGIKRPADQVRAAVFVQLPSRMIALIQAIQRGRIEELLAFAQVDPTLADRLEHLAATTPHADPHKLADASPPDEAPVAEPPDDEPEDEPDLQDHVSPTATDLLHLAQAPPWESAECPAAHPDGDPDGDPGDHLDQLEPPEHEPPPDDALDTAADSAGARPEAWTQWSMSELVVRLLSQSIRDPRILNVHVPASTLLELDNRTASLDGGAVLPARHARLLMPTATLRRVLVDPDSGIPLGVDPTLHAPEDANHPKAARAASPRQERLHEELRSAIDDVFGADADHAHLAGHAHLAVPVDGAQSTPGRLGPLLEPYLLDQRAERQHDPSATLRAFISLRDQRCTGIGCSHPASRSHQDHLVAYPVGPTAPWNLGVKSARCHLAKHAGWTVNQSMEGPGSDTITWTSPLGHSYERPSRWTRVPAPS